MASAQAQAFFDKQSPKDRMAIIDSWGGADLTDEWFKNAQAAGSTAAPAAAPGLGGGPSEADIRAGGVGQSEDFARFQSEDLERWAPNYDAAASQAAGRPQYRSSRGAPGFYDKPTECPPGQSPAGPDESSPCKGNDQLLAAQGAGQGGTDAAGGTGAQAGYYGQDDPLQRHLTNLMAGGGGTFGGTQTGGQFAGGGVFSQGSGQGGAPLTGAAAAAPAPVAPVAPAVNPAASSALTAFAGGAKSALTEAPAPVPMAQQVMGTSLKGLTPAAPQPDAFGVAPGSGSFEDLINPNRPKKDARLSGSWF